MHIYWARFVDSSPLRPLSQTASDQASAAGMMTAASSHTTRQEKANAPQLKRLSALSRWITNVFAPRRSVTRWA